MSLVCFSHQWCARSEFSCGPCWLWECWSDATQCYVALNHVTCIRQRRCVTKEGRLRNTTLYNIREVEVRAITKFQRTRRYHSRWWRRDGVVVSKTCVRACVRVCVSVCMSVCESVRSTLVRRLVTCKQAGHSQEYLPSLVPWPPALLAPHYASQTAAAAAALRGTASQLATISTHV